MKSNLLHPPTKHSRSPSVHWKYQQRLGRGGGGFTASPVAADGVVYAGSSYEKQALMAIRLDGAEGDITGTDNVVWTRSRGTPYVPSPLLYDGMLYFSQSNQNAMTAITTPRQPSSASAIVAAANSRSPRSQWDAARNVVDSAAPNESSATR